MSEFKVGEKVKVKNGTNNIPAGAIGTVTEVHCGFLRNSILVKFSQGFEGLHNGNEVSIKRYDENKYYFFYASDLEKIENETIVIYKKGNETIALDKRTGKMSVAKCDEAEDTYDFKTCAKIAFKRLIENKIKLSDLKPGSVFTAGEKKFVVLEQFMNTTAVAEIRELEKRKFDHTSNDWAISDLRKYLNTDVLNTYEQLFGKENIVESESDLTSLDGLTDYGRCDDKIRIMTFEERRKYQHLYERKEEWEWLITPWSTTKRGWDSTICAVSPTGNIGNINCFNDDAVRPFCILKSNIFVSMED